MSRTWTCRCGGVNDERSGWCEACGDPRSVGAAPPPKVWHEAQPSGHAPWAPTRPPPSGPPPCTLEQNLAAAAIFRAVQTREITRDEGNRLLAALFGPEVVAEALRGGRP